jgi:SpoIID/LytB domain protein
MEYYLRGLGETSNDSSLEFQKALLTGARTYAFYHWTHATKHASEFFTVDAYADQVYYGYDQESRTPRITEAVTETRGTIVTYQNAVAITPYFSRSDGHTRNWSDVWGGSVPWCQSVPVPSDVGKTLWGHGVGLSASGALAMAKQGQTWDQILKYFYTGIDLQQWWQ